MSPHQFSLVPLFDGTSDKEYLDFANDLLG